MKAFHELSEIELVELTAEQVQRYVDLACAEAGIRLMPPAPVPPTTTDDTTDDLTVYMIGNFVFTDQADAIRVLEVVNNAPSRGTFDYISGPSYRKRFTPRDGTEGGESVTPVRVLSAEKADRMGTILAAAEKASASYKKEKDLHDQIRRQRQNIVDDIDSAITAAQDRRWRRDALMRTYQRYVDLADGNTVTAARFLVRTEGEAVAELLPEIAGTAAYMGEVATRKERVSPETIEAAGNPF